MTVVCVHVSGGGVGCSGKRLASGYEQNMKVDIMRPVTPVQGADTTMTSTCYSCGEEGGQGGGLGFVVFLALGIRPQLETPQGRVHRFRMCTPAPPPAPITILLFHGGGVMIICPRLHTSAHLHTNTLLPPHTSFTCVHSHTLTHRHIHNHIVKH